METKKLLILFEYDNSSVKSYSDKNIPVIVDNIIKIAKAGMIKGFSTNQELVLDKFRERQHRGGTIGLDIIFVYEGKEYPIIDGRCQDPSGYPPIPSLQDTILDSLLDINSYGNED